MSCSFVEILSSEKPVNRAGRDRPVSDADVPSGNPSLKAHPTPAFTVSPMSKSADESGPSTHLSVVPRVAALLRPRSALHSLTSGRERRRPKQRRRACLSLAPPAPTGVPAGGANLASSGASAALGTAVSQPLGDGIRPMTMSPAPAGGAHLSAGHTPGTVRPDTGSGGNNDPPPNLSSGTFGISLESPGVYAGSTPIPIGAVAGLSVTSPGPTITSYAWSGGSAYAGYVSTPAASPPPASQAAPTAPTTNGQSYGFIVDGNPRMYTVTVQVNYQGGGQGKRDIDVYIGCTDWKPGRTASWKPKGGSN